MSNKSNASDGWKVLPHSSIVRLSENLWWLEGSLPNMTLKRAMTVVRLGDGRLVIHNGIAAEEAVMQQIAAWGTLAFLIVPSAIHRLDARAYKTRFPALRVFCPSGARAKVEQIVAVDGSYEEFVGDGACRFEMLHGMNEAEGAMIVRSQDGVSVVLNDAVFNMDRKRDWLGFLITSALGSAPGPRVSRLAKLTLIKDQAALRGDLERLAALPDLVRLIVAHEKVASGAEARAALLAAATYLR